MYLRLHLAERRWPVFSSPPWRSPNISSYYARTGERMYERIWRIVSAWLALRMLVSIASFARLFVCWQSSPFVFTAYRDANTTVKDTTCVPEFTSSLAVVFDPRAVIKRPQLFELCKQYMAWHVQPGCALYRVSSPWKMAIKAKWLAFYQCFGVFSKAAFCLTQFH